MHQVGIELATLRLSTKGFFARNNKKLLDENGVFASYGSSYACFNYFHFEAGLTALCVEIYVKLYDE